MRRYAEIYDNKVRGLHERDDDRTPEFHPDSGITVVEITGADPMPKQTWKYNKNSKKFSEPDPPDPQIAIDNKIMSEMLSKESRREAVGRLKDKNKLPQGYIDEKSQ